MALENALGPEFRDCVKHVGDRYREQDGDLNFPSAFYVENICSLSLVDRHNGFFSLLGTVAVACFTWTLWRSTEKLWVAGEKQIEAAQTSAAAAMAGQRAFIQITPYWEADRDHRLAGPPLQYAFGGRMENVGNTAAQNVRNHIDFRITVGDLPDNFVFPDDAVPIARAGTLGRQQWLLGPRIPRVGFITPKQVSDVTAGKINIHFFGWVKYSDGFKGTPERITKFYYTVRFTGNMDTLVVFNLSHRHNCSDDGCED